MLLVHMLCSLCLFNQYIHVLSLPIVSSHAYDVWCGLKCIFESVLCIGTHDDLKGTLLILFFIL